MANNKFSIHILFTDGSTDLRLFRTWFGAFITAQDLYERKAVANVTIFNTETGEVHYIANENFVNEPSGLGEVIVCQ